MRESVVRAVSEGSAREVGHEGTVLTHIGDRGVESSSLVQRSKLGGGCQQKVQVSVCPRVEECPGYDLLQCGDNIFKFVIGEFLCEYAESRGEG